MGKLFVTLFAFAPAPRDRFVMVYTATAPVPTTKFVNVDKSVAPNKLVPRSRQHAVKLVP